jgi:hypothetical protein
MKRGWGTEPLLRDADTTKWDSETPRRSWSISGDTPRPASRLTEIWSGWMVDDYDPPVGQGLDRMSDIAWHNRN